MQIICQWLLLTTVDLFVYGGRKNLLPPLLVGFSKLFFVLLALWYWNFLTFSFYLSEGCVKNLMKLGHSRGLWRYCFWLPAKKAMKSGYILNNFCVYVQNHICKPIKRQKCSIISLVSTKYFNQNQSILFWKNLGSLKKKHDTIFVDKKKKYCWRQQKTYHFDCIIVPIIVTVPTKIQFFSPSHWRLR